MRRSLTLWSLSFLLFTLASCAPAWTQDADNELLPGVSVEYWQNNELMDQQVAYELGGDWFSSFSGTVSADTPVTVVWSGWWLPDGHGDHQWLIVGTGEAQLTLDSTLIAASKLSTTPTAFGPLKSQGDWLPFKLRVTFSSATERLHVSWSGPNFAAEPLPGYRLMREPNPQLEQHELGRVAVKTLRCARCHQHEGWPLAPPASNLRTRVAHTDESWIQSHLKPPASEPDNSSLPQHPRKMPYFDLNEQQNGDLFAFLQSPEFLGPSLEKSNDVEREPTETSLLGDALAGWQHIALRGCLACHNQEDSIGQNQLENPGDLVELASHRTPEFLTRWLQDPHQVDSLTAMPRIELSPQEIVDIVSALQASRLLTPSNIHPQDFTQDSVLRGQELYQQLRCDVCHNSSDRVSFEEEPHLAINDFSTIPCLESFDFEQDAAVRPYFAVSSQVQQAIQTYLGQRGRFPRSAISEAINVPELLESNRCFACHTRSGRLATVKLAALESGHLPSSFEAGRLTAPALDGVGDKFREGTIEQILEQGSQRREWLALRMPIYHFTNEQSVAIARWFRSADRFPEPLVAPTAQVIPEAAFVHGSKLVTSSGFGCTSCHAIGNHRPVGVLPHALGPALDEVSARYERDWFDRWVRDPARLVPNMEMPSIRTAVRGILDEEVSQQLDAVWQTLSRPGFSPPKSDPHRIVYQTGNDIHARAWVIHDVLRSEDRTWIAPEVIGLANRHNVMFDLETGGLAIWWIGDVGRQYTEGKSWVWYPGGVPFVQSDATPEWSIATSTELFHPTPRDQFSVVTDQWQFDGPRLSIDQRWHFGPSGKLEVQVQQIWEPRQTEFNSATNINESVQGLRRTVIVRDLPANSELQLHIRSLAQEANLIETAAATWRVDATNPWFLQWKSTETSNTIPASSITSDANTGTLKVTADSQGNAAIVLDYLSSVIPDRIEPLTVSSPSGEDSDSIPQPHLEVVPGFSAELWGQTIEWMPTAMSWGSASEMFVTSLDGRVWKAVDVDGDTRPDSITETRDQLAAPFGLFAEQGVVDVIHKTALLRLYDDDRDGVTDRVRRLASGWGVTADYHDWAVGLPRDSDGAYWIALSCQQDERSRAAASLRGEVLRLVPDPAETEPTYRIEPVSAGHRFPIGIAQSRAGDVFVTDNQGNFNPFNELNLVERGRRYGFLNSWERKAGLTFPETPPTLAIPHPWTRSVNGICFLDGPSKANTLDDQEFGPFTGHLIGCEYDTRRLVRMSLETIDGVTQGAVYPFSKNTERAGAILLGPISCAVSPNNDLIIGTIRDSGWGGADNIGRLVRLRFEIESLPEGIAEIRALSNGFRIEFTCPLETTSELTANQLQIQSSRRESTPEYGGPELEVRSEEIEQLTLSEDRNSATVVLSKPLRPGFVYQFSIDVSAFATEFFPSEAFYTLHVVPQP